MSDEEWDYLLHNLMGEIMWQLSDRLSPVMGCRTFNDFTVDTAHDSQDQNDKDFMIRLRHLGTPKRVERFTELLTGPPMVLSGAIPKASQTMPEAVDPVLLRASARGVFGT